MIIPSIPQIFRPENFGNMCEAELMHYMQQKGLDWKQVLSKFIKSSHPYQVVDNLIVMVKEKAPDALMHQEVFARQGKMVVMVYGV